MAVRGGAFMTAALASAPGMPATLGVSNRALPSLTNSNVHVGPDTGDEICEGSIK
jgi:1-acyl-sn-glycerol-3-phosphate acyltransferase